MIDPLATLASGPGSPEFRNLATRRSAQDRIFERVRLTLAGTEYVLPVLKSGPNQRWLAKLDAETNTLLRVIQADETKGEEIVGIFSTPAIMPTVKAALYAYDQTGVLPLREELDELISDMQYVRALLEVWAAAHPLVGIVVATITTILMSEPSEPTSTPPPPTAGRRRRSRKN